MRFEEAGSQQTRISGFFRNVRSKFSGLSPKAEDVVITSHVVRKKPQLVIGSASNRISPSALLHSNGEPLAGKKRKSATEVEDVMNNRRMHEVSIPTTNALSDWQPAMKKEKGMVEAKVLEKKVAREQDRNWIGANEPISNAQEVMNTVEESVSEVQQNQSFVQDPPSLLQDSPPFLLKEARADTEVGKINKEWSFDSRDSENCTTSGNYQRKDELFGGKWSLPVDLKGTVFSCKLKEILAKPFDEREFKELWTLATRRKPVQKLRQTRGRTMQVNTKDEGLSYFDHHRDLAQRLEESSHPSGKLALLRCFFFWLQHSCMEGAYQPWAYASKNRTEEDDCDFTDGLDCEVLAVVLSLDEKKDVSSVVKPMEPITVDLSDDDEDDCLEISVKYPVKAVPKASNCNNFQKVASCNRCSKEFGMEKEQQRALYESCGHIETCMKCVDALWMEGTRSCQECGEIQRVRPRSIMDFADDSD